MVGKTTAAKSVVQSAIITEKVLRELIPVIVTDLLPTNVRGVNLVMFVRCQVPWPFFSRELCRKVHIVRGGK